MQHNSCFVFTLAANVNIYKIYMIFFYFRYESHLKRMEKEKYNLHFNIFTFFIICAIFIANFHKCIYLIITQICFLCTVKCGISVKKTLRVQASTGRSKKQQCSSGQTRSKMQCPAASSENRCVCMLPYYSSCR